MAHKYILGYIAGNYYYYYYTATLLRRLFLSLPEKNFLQQKRGSWLSRNYSKNYKKFQKIGYEINGVFLINSKEKNNYFSHFQVKSNVGTECACHNYKTEFNKLFSFFFVIISWLLVVNNLYSSRVTCPYKT